MTGELVSIKFTHAIAYNGMEKAFYCVAEQPLVKAIITKEGVTLVDRTHEIKIPMTVVQYIIYKKD